MMVPVTPRVDHRIQPEVVGEDAPQVRVRRVDMNGAITRGVIFVHSAPRALCPHVEWAAGTVLDGRVSFEWTPQPAAPGMFRAEYSWVGPVGTGARLASARSEERRVGQEGRSRGGAEA